jgi:hypothetical protein
MMVHTGKIELSASVEMDTYFKIEVTGRPDDFYYVCMRNVGKGKQDSD